MKKRGDSAKGGIKLNVKYSLKSSQVKQMYL